MVRKNKYILAPGRYIDFVEVKEDEQAFELKMKYLIVTLSGQMKKAIELDGEIKKNLKKAGFEINDIKVK